MFCVLKFFLALNCSSHLLSTQNCTCKLLWGYLDAVTLRGLREYHPGELWTFGLNAQQLLVCVQFTMSYQMFLAVTRQTVPIC